MRHPGRIAVCVGVLLLGFQVSQAFEMEDRIPERIPNTPEMAITRDLAAGRISRQEAALYRAYELFKPDGLPDRYKTGVKSQQPVCLTPLVLRLQRDWENMPEEGRALVPRYMHPGSGKGQVFVRKGTVSPGTVQEFVSDKVPAPDDDDAPAYNRTYATTNFLIHWMNSGSNAPVHDEDNNGNGTPDMIEFAGQYFEATWDWAIAHGYRQPPGTETEYLYNVYITGFPPGLLGRCSALDYPDRHSRSHIELTNDFEGYPRVDFSVVPWPDMMRAAATHEFFHAIQFAYDTLEDVWWMEATTSWLEEFLGPEWDAANTSTWRVWEFLLYPEVSLDADYWSGHWYDDVLWTFYLVSHYDPDGSIVRDIWEACEGPTNALQATKNVILNYEPAGFRKVWLDFLVANYTQDYPEAPEWPEAYGNMYYVATHYTYPTGTLTPAMYLPEGLGSNYVHFFPSSSSNPDLSVTFTAASQAASWAGMIVGNFSGDYQRSDISSGGSDLVIGFVTWADDAVLIVTPNLGGYVNGQEFSYNYSAHLEAIDVYPPTPSPLTWQAAPQAVSTVEIAMTATTATESDNPPVEYYFDEMTGNEGGNDRDWQESTGFSDGGLGVNTRYGYRVRSRDSSPRRNAGGWSATVYAHTLCNTPAAPLPYDPAPTKLYISLAASDGNPEHTLYAVYNQTLGKYVGSDGSPSDTAYFATRTDWDSIRARNLSPSTSYTFKAKARNGDGFETGFGPSQAASTLPADTVAPVLGGIGKIPTWVKEGVTTSMSIVATGNDRSTGGSDIVQAEYYMDTDPGEGGGTPVQAADGSFNSPVEALSATVDTSGWTIAQSPYNVYIRAMDEAGFWSTAQLAAISVVDAVPPTAVTDLTAAPTPTGLEELVGLSVESVTSESANHLALDAIDTSELTWWASEPQGAPSAEEITVAFSAPAVVSTITLSTSARADLFPSRFRIKLGDETNWWTVASEYDYAASPGANTWQVAARTATRAKIVIEETPFDGATDLYAAEIAEIMVKKDAGGLHALQLSWTAPSDFGPLGRASSYTIKTNTDPIALGGSFQGSVPDEPAPAPAAAASPENMIIMNLEPATTYCVALKSSDEYDNTSAISNVPSVTTLPDTRAWTALDWPVDQVDLDIEAPPAFAWSSHLLDTFKVQFSNVPSFPAKAYKDDEGRIAKTMQFGIKKGQQSFTPSEGVWKTLKAMAASMDGTLYWRVEGKAGSNKALGVVYSDVFHEYGFASGSFFELFIGPYHDRNGVEAVWPDGRPQFLWSVASPTYGSFYIEFSASPDINPIDKKATISMLSKNEARTWWRPTPSEWKNIKKLAGPNDGLVYWRVRGVDPDKGFHAASDPMAMLIDSPAFALRRPAPRRDGTVMPGEVFTLDWNINGEGYNMFEVQVSTASDFPKGPQTFTLKKLEGFEYTLKESDVKKLQKILDAAGTDTFLWRVIATDIDKVMSVPSPPESVRVSETPAQVDDSAQQQ